jgi:hypothetical protein
MIFKNHEDSENSLIKSPKALSAAECFPTQVLIAKGMYALFYIM